MSSIFAYLDPGSGSVILQAILGGFAAVAVTFKLWWKRVTGIFKRGDDDETPQPATTTTAGTPEESA
jgi:hypothetical protein